MNSVLVTLYCIQSIFGYLGMQQTSSNRRRLFRIFLHDTRQ